MEAYIYQAAWLCEDCANDVKLKNEQLRLNSDGTENENSDQYPQGPYDNGGGEADCPQHCDRCNVFLENPLTGDGYDYVAESIDNYNHGSSREVLTTWAEFYKNEADDLDRAIEESGLIPGFEA